VLCTATGTVAIGSSSSSRTRGTTC
jgi:hypothetical protein